MKKQTIFLLATFILCCTIMAQNFHTDPFAHTFSIVAWDSVTGEMGVAVQTHAFSVGTAVTWGEAGAGVIATQASTKIAFGPAGLKLLKEGKLPEEVVKILTEHQKRALETRLFLWSQVRFFFETSLAKKQLNKTMSLFRYSLILRKKEPFQKLKTRSTSESSGVLPRGVKLPFLMVVKPRSYSRHPNIKMYIWTIIQISDS